ncbi:helix-turn-helix domain-containing protein [Streptomyces sp. NPDC085931]|uniref:helix-turn-helix transcriptional regulator n=1 Tax=Streptomyces sp. NPDC085931 TaxID=3365740 RepID=UPI0037CDFBAD
MNGVEGVEGVEGGDDVAQFAASLRALKERTDRSYGSLARRLAMNTSTLHRYCAGEAVPLDFAPVERFAALCGASPDERLDLHRRWLLAVAARRRPRGTATDGVADGPGGMAEGVGAAQDADAAQEGRTPLPAVPPRDPRAAQAAGTTQNTSAPQAPGAPQHTGAVGDSGTGQDDGAARDGGASQDEHAAQTSGAPQDEHAARTSGGTEDEHAAGDAGALQDARAARDAGGTQDERAAGDAGASQGERAAQSSGAAPGACVGPGTGGSPGARSGQDSGVAVRLGEAPGGGELLARRPWYRRRRLAVGVAAACVALAGLGSLAALPDGRRAEAGDRAREAGPVSPGATKSPAPERRGASPTPSTSPTPGRSSPSAGPKAKGKPVPAPSGPTTAPPRSGSDPAAPLTWSADSQAWKLGCGHDYVVTRPPDQVPPPPVPQDAGAWAASENAVHGGETLVRLSVQGRSDTAVVLEALRVRVVGRADPVQGNAYAMDQGCGGSLTPRSFDVDLDKDRPIARAVAGNDAGTPIPAVSMPYRVSARDPEVLLVNARTQGCDCRWYLELDWSSQGRSGTVRVDDGGRPFRTSGIAGLPRYLYDTSARAWAPYR